MRERPQPCIGSCAWASPLCWQVNSQCNLNWQDYYGCAEVGPDNKPVGHAPGWAYFIRIIILIFPALDVMSAFPLNAVTLGNNLMV